MSNNKMKLCDVSEDMLEGFITSRTPELIDVSSCQVSKYQKIKLNKKLIENVQNEFELDLLDPIVVNAREGINWIVEGSHRWRSFYEIGMCKMPAIIKHESEEWEYNYFSKVNNSKTRKNLTTNDIFINNYLHGDEREVLIVNIAKRNDCDINPNSVSNFKITSLITLVKIYNYDMTGDVLDKTLRTINNGWGYEVKGATDVALLEGVAKFHITFLGKYSQEWLEKRLQEDSIFPNTIKKHTKKHNRLIDVEDFNPMNIMLALVEFYNNGIRKTMDIQTLKYEGSVF